MVVGRWARRAFLLVTLAVALSLAAIGCTETITSKQLYEQHCADCHGEQGNRLPIAPLDSKDFLSSVGQAGLVAATRDGKGAMPAWGLERGGPLDDQQIMAVIQYLETGQSQPVKPVQIRGEGDIVSELLHNPAVLMAIFTVVLVGFLWTMNRLTSHS